MAEYRPRAADRLIAELLLDGFADQGSRSCPHRFRFGVLLTTAPEALPFGPRLAALSVSSLWS